MFFFEKLQMHKSTMPERILITGGHRLSSAQEGDGSHDSFVTQADVELRLAGDVPLVIGYS